MLRGAEKWLPGYLASLARRRTGGGTRHLLLAVCDHYEPYRGGASRDRARALVARWADALPPLVAPFRDADGRPPRHTFFYPEEEYDPACLDTLADLTRRGFGEVEIHLHHRHDTRDGLREKLERFRDTLRRGHGLLGSTDSTPSFGFIHGNWSLCNSRPDGDWCGVNEELAVLDDAGCYADFTYPSAPSPTQPPLVNTLYRAWDNPAGRGADRGIRLAAGTPPPERNGRTGLVLITGPLLLNWRRRKWGLLPRLENGELSGANPPAPDRIRLWTTAGVGVEGCPDWVFVKLHTHGCVPANADVLLGEPMRRLHETLAAHFNDGLHWRLHYVSARELYNLAIAAEAGKTGDPGPWLNTAISPPPCMGTA